MSSKQSRLITISTKLKILRQYFLTIRNNVVSSNSFQKLPTHDSLKLASDYSGMNVVFVFSFKLLKPENRGIFVVFLSFNHGMSQ